MDGVIGATYTIGPIAAIIAPLFLGVIADRIFASQKVLSALHLIGAIAIILAPMTAKGFSLETSPMPRKQPAYLENQPPSGPHQQQGNPTRDFPTPQSTA